MIRSIALGSVAALALSACAAMRTAPAQALADLAPTQGSKTRGTVKFTQAGAHVIVEARLEGLSPGPHGFHVHEKGDCSAPDGTSAGGHFNPFAKPHGPHTSPNRHAGDLPSLQAGADGVATLKVEIDALSVASGAPGDVVGRSVIVHANADDFTTQPTGNSGGRLACGVIRRM